MEMKCVIVINHRVLNVLFTQELRPLKSVYLNRNKCQREGATSLFNYTFPGIKQPCIDKNNEIVINKECDKPGYRLIKEIPAKNISIWRNKLICGDYYDFLSDTDFKLIGQNDLCSDEYKQCGFINTKTNTTGIHKKFCIKQELECPINFIEITNNISLYEYDEETYNLFPFDSDYYLVTSNKIIENSIIINIQISEGELPCYSEKRYSTTTSQFPSINNIERFKCMENQKQ